MKKRALGDVDLQLWREFRAWGVEQGYTVRETFEVMAREFLARHRGKPYPGSSPRSAEAVAQSGVSRELEPS